MLISVALGRLRTINRELAHAVDERRMLAALVDASSDFIGITDTSGRPSYVNPAGRRMVGNAARSAPHRTVEPRLLSTGGAGRGVSPPIPALAQRGRWQGETRLRNLATGATFPVSLNRFAITDPDTGRPLGRGKITRDISGTKELERSLREQADDLRRAEAVAGFGSWRFDRTKGTSASSDETLRIVGLPPGTRRPAR